MTIRTVLLAIGFAAHATAQAPLREMASPDQQDGGRFGNAVAGASDIDADGVPDFFLGAVAEDVGSAVDAGRTYIFSGAAGTSLRAIESPNPELGGAFGHAVAAVPDTDGDGWPDLVVGARRESPGASPELAGRAYIFSGFTGALIRVLSSPNEEAVGLFGTAVAGMPDVDGDGRGDVAIGAYNEGPGTSPDGAGRAYIYSGATGTVIHTLASPNEEEGGGFGHAIAMVPDTNGDGFADVLVGADFEDPGDSPSAAGRAYLYSGASGGLLHGFQSPNEEDGGFFGGAVSGSEDFDGDGRGDILVGADFENPGASPISAGRAYAFSGASGVLQHVLAAPVQSEIGRFGFTVEGVGDLDGDSRGDILVGAPFDDSGGMPTDAGRAYLFSGATGAFLRELSSPNGQSGGAFGNSSAGVGDIDGDGTMDVLVAAQFESQGTGPEAAGRVYLFSGGDLTAVESPNGGTTSLSVAPNPAGGHWEVTLVLDAPAVVRVSVYDVLGRELGPIHEGILPSGANSFTRVAALPNGTYLVRAVTAAWTATAPLTVARDR